MINYWLEKISEDKKFIEEINKILAKDAQESEQEKDWELDL